MLNQWNFIVQFLSINCSDLFSQSFNKQDKFKVTRLKVGGCDHFKVKELVNEFPNLYELYISNSEFDDRY